MPTAETLRALIALVEEAKAGSRELDAEIGKAFGWKMVFPHRYWQAPRDWVPLSLSEGIPFFTTSIDAALALVAKVLPGTVRLALVQGPRADWGCALLRVEPDSAPSPHFTAETAPLAILAALLRALLQQSETAHVER